jgi:hypothetical protein
VAELLVELEVLEARVAVRVGVGPRVAVEAQEARTEFAPHLVCKRDAANQRHTFHEWLDDPLLNVVSNVFRCTQRATILTRIDSMSTN